MKVFFAKIELMGLSKLKLICEAVDEALSFFGKTVREVVYYYCEVKFNVKRSEIPFKLNFFTACLEEIFGDSAFVIEKMILEKLSAKLGVDLKGRSLKELLSELLENLDPLNGKE